MKPRPIAPILSAGGAVLLAAAALVSLPSLSLAEPSCDDTDLQAAVEALAAAPSNLQAQLATAIPRTTCTDLPKDYVAFMKKAGNEKVAKWAELVALESWSSVCADPAAAQKGIETGEMSVVYGACEFADTASVDAEAFEGHSAPALAAAALVSERLMVDAGASPKVATRVAKLIAGL